MGVSLIWPGPGKDRQSWGGANLKPICLPPLESVRVTLLIAYGSGSLKAHLSLAAPELEPARSLARPPMHPLTARGLTGCHCGHFCTNNILFCGWVDAISQGRKGGDVHCPSHPAGHAGAAQEPQCGGSWLAFYQKGHLPGSCHKGSSCPDLEGTPEAL